MIFKICFLLIVAFLAVGNAAPPFQRGSAPRYYGPLFEYRVYDEPLPPYPASLGMYLPNLPMQSLADSTGLFALFENGPGVPVRSIQSWRNKLILIGDYDVLRGYPILAIVPAAPLQFPTSGPLHPHPSNVAYRTAVPLPYAFSSMSTYFSYDFDLRLEDSREFGRFLAAGRYFYPQYLRDNPAPAIKLTVGYRDGSFAPVSFISRWRNALMLVGIGNQYGFPILSLLADSMVGGYQSAFPAFTQTISVHSFPLPRDQYPAQPIQPVYNVPYHEQVVEGAEKLPPGVRATVINGETFYERLPVDSVDLDRDKVESSTAQVGQAFEKLNLIKDQRLEAQGTSNNGANQAGEGPLPNEAAMESSNMESSTKLGVGSSSEVIEKSDGLRSSVAINENLAAKRSPAKSTDNGGVISVTELQPPPNPDATDKEVSDSPVPLNSNSGVAATDEVVEKSDQKPVTSDVTAQPLSKSQKKRLKRRRQAVSAVAGEFGENSAIGDLKYAENIIRLNATPLKEMMEEFGMEFPKVILSSEFARNVQKELASGPASAELTLKHLNFFIVQLRVFEILHPQMQQTVRSAIDLQNRLALEHLLNREPLAMIRKISSNFALAVQIPLSLTSSLQYLGPAREIIGKGPYAEFITDDLDSICSSLLSTFASLHKVSGIGHDFLNMVEPFELKSTRWELPPMKPISVEAFLEAYKRMAKMRVYEYLNVWKSPEFIEASEADFVVAGQSDDILETNLKNFAMLNMKYLEFGYSEIGERMEKVEQMIKRMVMAKEDPKRAGSANLEKYHSVLQNIVREMVTDLGKMTDMPLLMVNELVGMEVKQMSAILPPNYHRDIEKYDALMDKFDDITESADIKD